MTKNEQIRLTNWRFKVLQQAGEARSLKRGLWAEKFWTSPWDWRTSQRDSLFFVSDYSNATTASCIRAISNTPVFDE